MAQSYDINEVPPDDEPCTEREAENAVLYLQKFCQAAGDNLYDHLSQVLSMILSERPRNPFAFFDKYSKKLRDDKFRMRNDYLRDLYVPPALLKNAKKLVDLFKVNVSNDEDNQSLEDGNEETENSKEVVPNLFDDFYYFEQCDVGLPRSEVVLLNLSIRKLVFKTKIKDVRFWGKILGRPKNYYIAEAKLPDSELERRLEELQKKESKDVSSKSAESDAKEALDQRDAEKQALEAAMMTELSAKNGEHEPGITEDKSTFKFDLPPLPENTWKPPPEVSSEKLGTGANAQVYFVCNSPGLDEWKELPTVTPQQIVVARHTAHLFTGNLETQIHTFPPFPGCEKNYLRAQIARIGASTHVSPVGYFTFGSGQQEDDEYEDEEVEEEEEEEGDEEEGGGERGEGELVENKRYEQLPIKELIDPSMSNWCHCTPYILKQGRATWQDPTKVDGESEDNEEKGEKGESEEEEDEEEKDEEEEDDEIGNKNKGVIKEIGPPLLTPLSEDAASGLAIPWTARQSSRIHPDTAIAFVRSNVWPGAFAFAADKKFGNVYIGWGHKHNAYNYNPPLMPAIQDQYSEIDSELAETQDPSFEEEEAYRLAHLPPPPSDDAEEDENEEETDETETGNDDED